MCICARTCCCLLQALGPAVCLLCEKCKLDPLMNVFFHHIRVQSKYAIYAHLGCLFTDLVCQAFRPNENLDGQNRARHPLLTSCRSTARHGCYAVGNAENLQAPTDERFQLSPLSDSSLRWRAAFSSSYKNLKNTS